jgi:hypothetical protein
MSVIDKVLKYGPNWENQRQDPQIEHINIFLQPHAPQANIIYARGGQHEPAPTSAPVENSVHWMG